MPNERGRLILGTSGFAYKHWRDVLYPKGTPQSRWLEVYAESFRSVELNVSFYRLPSRDAFAEWERRTPDDFEFVVKGSRTITHYRRLRNAEDQLAELFGAASGLGSKLSCMLWQLPPRGAPDIAVLDGFCALLAECGSEFTAGTTVRHAFEFRDSRWFADDVLDVLRNHRCGLVIADPPQQDEPKLLTADFAYLRFHHGPRPSGGYEKAELRPYAEKTAEWLGAGLNVYAFFNNDPGGWAPRNALSFGHYVERELTGVVPKSALSQ